MRYCKAASMSHKRFEPISSKKSEIIHDSNRELIGKSQLRVILMFGSFNQDILVPEKAPKITVNFKGFDFDMFLENDGQHIIRIYVKSPAALPTLPDTYRMLPVGGTDRQVER
jgi:hypothetical protein